MKDKTAPEFDFDDWAGLFIENPQEFEARRQATLMIELSRRDARQRELGKATLAAFEKRVSGRDTHERMEVAAQMMADSALQMQTELKLLTKMLEDAVDGSVESETDAR